MNFNLSLSPFNFFSKIFAFTTLLGLGLIAGPSNATLQEGKDYTILPTPPSEQKQIAEFFSFYCSHCYEFEMVNHVSKVINDAIAKQGKTDQVKFVLEHTNFFNPSIAPLITRAWVIAQNLGVADKAKDLFYTKLRADYKSINNKQQVIDVLVEAGADQDAVEKNWNSLATNLTYNKMVKAAEDSKISATPSFVVNGRYLINMNTVPQGGTWNEFLNNLALRALELSELP